MGVLFADLLELGEFGLIVGLGVGVDLEEFFYSLVEFIDFVVLLVYLFGEL